MEESIEIDSLLVDESPLPSSLIYTDNSGLIQSFSARFEYVYFVVRRNDIIGQLLIRLGK